MTTMTEKAYLTTHELVEELSRMREENLKLGEDIIKLLRENAELLRENAKLKKSYAMVAKRLDTVETNAVNEADIQEAQLRGRELNHPAVIHVPVQSKNAN